MLEDFSEFPVRKSLLHNLKGWCPSQEMNESITSDTSDQSSEPYLNSTNTGGPQSGKTATLTRGSHFRTVDNLELSPPRHDDSSTSSSSSLSPGRGPNKGEETNTAECLLWSRLYKPATFISLPQNCTTHLTEEKPKAWHLAQDHSVNK